MGLLHFHIILLVIALTIIIFFLFRNIFKLTRVKKETVKEKRILTFLIQNKKCNMGFEVVK